MWIGTATGLFLLDIESGKYERIQLPVESTYVYSLYQTKQGSLYIGTSGSGVLIYDPQTKLFTHYYTGERTHQLLSQTKNLLQLDKGNGTDDYALQCVVRYPAQK